MIKPTSRLARYLCDAGLEFTTKPIQHGRQFAFGQAKFTQYDTGTIRWQGDDEPPPKLRAKVERLSERSKRNPEDSPPF